MSFCDFVLEGQIPHLGVIYKSNQHAFHSIFQIIHKDGFGTKQANSPSVAVIYTMPTDEN